METETRKLIDLLIKKRKMTLSEAAKNLNIKEMQLNEWVSTLEERGVVEVKYPVLGEPEVVLKSLLPDDIILVPEKKEVVAPQVKEVEVEKETETYKILETEDKEIKELTEKTSELEKKTLELTQEMDISNLKEELFETLIIILSLDNIERIAYYLSLIERVILALKAVKAWEDIDKDLMVSSLKSTANNWRKSGKEDTAKIFDEMSKRIEMI